jgi:hypothetical protein
MKLQHAGLVAVLLTMLAHPAAVAGPKLDAVELARQIDQAIQARLDAEKVKPSPQADDAEFLRRLYLDLHGVVPTPDRVTAFLDSRDPAKRARLIDELLASPRYGQHLADIWLFYLYPPAGIGRYSPEALTKWLEDAFNKKPWNKQVYELLTASGSTAENPAATYLVKGRELFSPAELTDLASQYFLGVRLNCAQCHNHPFASWKKTDYWGMAAFFSQMEQPFRGQANIKDNPRADLKKQPDYEKLKAAVPTFLGGEKPKVSADILYRPMLADWVTSPSNPYFARALANRMWGHFFGRGLVNPVDDMHDGNPPSHPELLQLLTEQFVANGFDHKFLCRAICNSQVYQRTSKPLPGAERETRNAESETELFSRMPIKVLSPEQLYDSLLVVTGAPAQTGGGARSGGTRLSPRAEFLSFFRSDGEPEPTSYERGIPQLLRLMNSPQFLTKGRGEVAGLPSTAKPAAQAVEELYLRVLSRRPTRQEADLMSAYLKKAGTGQQAYGEIFWTLLNSSEFSLNH